MFGFTRRIRNSRQRGSLRERIGVVNERSPLVGEQHSSDQEDEEHGAITEQEPIPSTRRVTNNNNEVTSDNFNDVEENGSEAQTEETIADQINIITNRLRVLFYTLYIPVIPLFTLLVILLVSLVARASYSPPCSYPLRFYAILSVILFVYLPNHKRIKRWLFNYNRERDLTRPRALRIYDQCFHMLVLAYVYLDMILVQSCKEDLDPGGSGESTCMMTCPELYESFQRFDFILRIFTAVLLLPLVCLPFVYVWIIRRISAVDADALTRLGVHLGGADNDDLAGGATVKSIVEGFRNVTLESNESYGEDKVRVVGIEKQSWSGDKLKDWHVVRDCCICMSQFECQGRQETNDDETQTHDDIVETKCGHLFHRSCILQWIGGEDWEEASSSGRARRKNCPLCREDLVHSGID